MSELDPSDVRNLMIVWLHDAILCLIVPPIDEHCRHVDLVRIGNDSPTFEQSSNRELEWAVPIS